MAVTPVSSPSRLALETRDMRATHNVAHISLVRENNISMVDRYSTVTPPIPQALDILAILGSPRHLIKLSSKTRAVRYSGGNEALRAACCR